ncbi:MAG TPA: RpiB/LacA/LacB family sugar-phosphate isomerase [Balneolaceae bacterium]|nr:RpiB/LacA/LacB family sugar-phosphate isomerase [Balneolales bacterium]HKK44187.1 RpiB/LacA/LacB family sugar-phosphate isomerase [Balneolaceae bacterium]
MKIGIATDHGGFDLKTVIEHYLKSKSYEIEDFGAYELNPGDDYPDYIIPLAEAVASGEVERGIAICGSGVGASITANKIEGVRAALIHDIFSAHQGVEDDNMNIICFGGRVTGPSLAKELVDAFLKAEFSGQERHLRRIRKVKDYKRS